MLNIEHLNILPFGVMACTLTLIAAILSWKQAVLSRAHRIVIVGVLIVIPLFAYSYESSRTWKRERIPALPAFSAVGDLPQPSLPFSIASSQEDNYLPAWLGNNLAWLPYMAHSPAVLHFIRPEKSLPLPPHIGIFTPHMFSASRIIYSIENPDTSHELWLYELPDGNAIHLANSPVMITSAHGICEYKYIAWLTKSRQGAAIAYELHILNRSTQKEETVPFALDQNSSWNLSRRSGDEILLYAPVPDQGDEKICRLRVITFDPQTGRVTSTLSRHKLSLCSSADFAKRFAVRLSANGALGVLDSTEDEFLSFPDAIEMPTMRAKENCAYSIVKHDSACYLARLDLIRGDIKIICETEADMRISKISDDGKLAIIATKRKVGQPAWKSEFHTPYVDVVRLDSGIIKRIYNPRTGRLADIYTSLSHDNRHLYISWENPVCNGYLYTIPTEWLED